MDYCDEALREYDGGGGWSVGKLSDVQPIKAELQLSTFQPQNLRGGWGGGEEGQLDLFLWKITEEIENLKKLRYSAIEFRISKI